MRLTSLEDFARSVVLRERATAPLADLAALRDELPPTEPLTHEQMRRFIGARRVLCQLDKEAAKMHTAAAETFRCELRAATAWLPYADLPGLPSRVWVHEQGPPPEVGPPAPAPYHAALRAARSLVEEPTIDAPDRRAYMRGMVELIADMFPRPGQAYMVDRKRSIAADLGWPPEMVE